MRVTVASRGPQDAVLHVLPHLWARNTWSWEEGARKPDLRLAARWEVDARHPSQPDMRLHAPDASAAGFCDNETNTERLFGVPGPAHPKDSIDRWIAGGDASGLNPDMSGTKCALLHVLEVPAGGQRTIRLRFRRAELRDDPTADFDEVFRARVAEADEFYEAVHAGEHDADRRRVQRQALAGMLWSKQFYAFDIMRWMDGDPGMPSPPACRREGRNSEWRHLATGDVISMPDAFEYPWFASWDLAFHCMMLVMVDPDFAKSQLLLLTRERYMHPAGR
jgi:hypothetical protein